MRMVRSRTEQTKRKQNMKKSVSGVLSTMKSLTRAGVFATLLALASCTTVGTPDIARISASVHEAARIGVSECLRERPDFRTAFIITRDQLNTLAAQNILTVDALLIVLSNLPVDELSSDTARLSFEAARLVLVTAGWSDVVIVRTDQLRPVVTALSAGITAGLGQEAAMTVRSSAKHYRAK